MLAGEPYRAVRQVERLVLWCGGQAPIVLVDAQGRHDVAIAWIDARDHVFRGFHGDQRMRRVVGVFSDGDEPVALHTRLGVVKHLLRLHVVRFPHLPQDRACGRVVRHAERLDLLTLHDTVHDDTRPVQREHEITQLRRHSDTDATDLLRTLIVGVPFAVHGAQTGQAQTQRAQQARLIVRKPAGAGLCDHRDHSVLLYQP